MLVERSATTVTKRVETKKEVLTRNNTKSRKESPAVHAVTKTRVIVIAVLPGLIV
jgi:hypothetical protein